MAIVKKTALKAAFDWLLGLVNKLILYFTIKNKGKKEERARANKEAQELREEYERIDSRNSRAGVDDKSHLLERIRERERKSPE